MKLNAGDVFKLTIGNRQPMVFLTTPSQLDDFVGNPVKGAVLLVDLDCFFDTKYERILYYILLQSRKLYCTVILHTTLKVERFSRYIREVIDSDIEYKKVKVKP